MTTQWLNIYLMYQSDSEEEGEKKSIEEQSVSSSQRDMCCSGLPAGQINALSSKRQTALLDSWSALADADPDQLFGGIVLHRYVCSCILYHNLQNLRESFLHAQKQQLEYICKCYITEQAAVSIYKLTQYPVHPRELLLIIEREGHNTVIIVYICVYCTSSICVCHWTHVDMLHSK